MAVMHVLHSITHDTHAQIDALTMTIVWPSWRNIPYSNCVVKGASDKLISHRIKAQKEDLCSVTLDEIKNRAWSLTISFLFCLKLPLLLRPLVDENTHLQRNINY